MEDDQYFFEFYYWLLNHSAQWWKSGFCLLTTCSLSIASNVVLFHFVLYAGLLPHFLDLRHAKLGIEAEEEFSSFNGQIVLTPVPQVLQVLVVHCIECVHPKIGKKHTQTKQQSIKY